MVIKIRDLPGSFRTQRVIALCKLHGIQYEVVSDVGSAGTKLQYSALSHDLPVIENDDGLLLFEFNDIMTYLATKYCARRLDLILKADRLQAEAGSQPNAFTEAFEFEPYANGLLWDLVFG